MSDSAALGLSTDLSGQIALITGASQGLGKACAVRLAGCGATALCVARSADKLAQVVAVGHLGGLEVDMRLALAEGAQKLGLAHTPAPVER